MSKRRYRFILESTTVLLCMMLILVVYQLNGCALMPRTVFSSNTDELAESSTVGKYHVQIHQIDASVMKKNNKNDFTI